MPPGKWLEDLRGLTCTDDEETDFLENMRHLQVHRRIRAMRKLVKRIGEDPELLSKTTLTRYIQGCTKSIVLGSENGPIYRATQHLRGVS